ncbi:RHS repeat-associated core domain-containing protein, partial [Microbulbifer epialgicus]
KIGFSHRDRLGSAAAVGDEAGNLKESHSFDPFGKPRQGNILDKDTAILESAYSTRGFTDHEHLDDVELIHMNGRAYDYNLGRFLSVDPIIQSPGNSQSLNPYSYIMNNPLAGTDPSGYVCAASRLESVCGSLPSHWGGNGRGKAKKQNNGFNLTKIENAINQAVVALLQSDGVQAADIGSQDSRGNLQGGGSDTGGAGAAGRALSASFGALRRFASDIWYMVSHTEEMYLNIGLQWVTGTLADSFVQGIKSEGTASLDAAADNDSFGFGYHAMGVVGAVMLRRGAPRRSLNLGSGSNPMKDAVNVDIRPVEGVDVVADATKLPFGSGSFTQVHSINPYGFNPVSTETARVMQPGSLLYVTGNATRNSFARPLSVTEARAAGFEIVNTGPVLESHFFGVQRATSGKVLDTSFSTTTIYRKVE